MIIFFIVSLANFMTYSQFVIDLSFIHSFIGKFTWSLVTVYSVVEKM